MANELRHTDVGTSLTKAEWEAVGSHVLNSQATGDIIYGSSATQLTRLGIGSAGNVLRVTGGVPVWSNTFTGITWPDLGVVTTVDINGGTVDGVTIGGAAAGAGTFTSVTAAPATTTNSTAVTITGNDTSGGQGFRGISLDQSGLGDGTTTPVYAVHYTAAGAGVMVISLGAIGGTRAAPAATVDESVLARFGGFGYGAAITGDKAILQFTASEVWSATNQGTRFTIELTPDASTTRGERFRMVGTGAISTLGADPANVSAAGSAILGGGIAMTDVLNAWIDDATHGDGTTTHYIGNQTITTSSDVRVKTDVATWQGAALDLLRQGHLVEFRYDLPGGGPQDSGYGPNARGKYLGFTAQETIKWAPWVVNAGAGADCQQCLAGLACDRHSPWHVEYQHLVPLIVRGVQEIDARLATLEAENAQLRARVAELGRN